MLKSWARLETSNRTSALTRKAAAHGYARSSPLGHTDVHMHRTWHRAGKDNCIRLWQAMQIQKNAGSLKAEVTLLPETLVLPHPVHHNMTGSLPGKWLLSEFIMGRGSSKCKGGDLSCLSPTISECTHFRHRFLSPWVISRPQNRWKGIAIHHTIQKLLKFHLTEN